MKEVNATLTAWQENMLDSELKTAMPNKVLGISTYGAGRPISIWLDDSATQADMDAALSIAQAHDKRAQAGYYTASANITGLKPSNPFQIAGVYRMAKGQLQLEVDAATFTQNLTNLLAMAKELNTRFADTTQADVTALANNSDILPGTHLTKLQWNQFFQMTGDLILFMENGAAAQAWRRSIAYGISTVNKT